MGGADDLYREQILEHHRAPHNFGVLEQPSVSADGRNPSCGDLITMQLKLDDAGVITDVAFSGRGCAISLQTNCAASAPRRSPNWGPPM
jgi:nitrogen fixation NifU-like protein